MSEDIKDVIFIKEKEMESILTQDCWILPREKASDSKYIKHVSCHGARFHVLWWNSNGVHCSEKDCIVNKLKET